MIILVLVLGPGLAQFTEAHHNDAGLRFGLGDPDPVPSTEPDTPRELTPVYHAGGSSSEPAFHGSLARGAPLDQSGLGMGRWIGFLDAIVQVPSLGIRQCTVLDPGTYCRHEQDPLYRVNPLPGDDACRDLGNRLDPDRCNGEDHPMHVDLWPGVRLHPHRFPWIGQDASQGSGPIYPGTYTFYAYVLGDGSGPAAGQAPLGHLDEDLCEDHLAKLKELGRIPGSRTTQQAERCRLITPGDLADHQRRTSALGTVQGPGVCLFAPHFVTLSGESGESPCPTNGAYRFQSHSRSPFKASNLPGWYLDKGFVDHRGSVVPQATTRTLGGEHAGIGRIFHTYVNPVPVASEYWCAAPPISTSARDGLTTGHLLRGSGEGWVKSGPEVYLVEGHDLDVHTQPEVLATLSGPFEENGVGIAELLDETQHRAYQELAATLRTVTDPLQGRPGQLPGMVAAVADGILGGSNDTQRTLARADPTVGPRAEPNHPEDDSHRLVAPGRPSACSLAHGLRTGQATEATPFLNLVQATVASSTDGPDAPVDPAGIGGGPLHDYTYLDETGLPAESHRQGFNPWAPDTYTVGGRLLVFQDLDQDQRFSGCPLGTDPPTPEAPDLCAARLPWDLYNPQARTGGDRTVGEVAREQGFADPTGLVLVLKVTGPLVVTSLEVPATPQAAQEGAERTRFLASQNQNCLVATSTGLIAGGTVQRDRFRTLLDLPPDASGDQIAQALCGPVGGETHLLQDGFLDGQADGTFAAGFSWTKTTPTPHATHPATGDGLRLTAMITVQEGGDARTADNLGLGSREAFDEPGEPTVVHRWEDGQLTYAWTDVDPFESEPATPS